MFKMYFIQHQQLQNKHIQLESRLSLPFTITRKAAIKYSQETVAP